MTITALSGIRDRMLPMLQLVAEQYRHRVPDGYPTIVDSVPQGLVGIELDPSYAVYVTSDGERLFAELYRRAPRTDARSSAGRQKHGGLPFHDRRPLEPNVSDQDLRNLVAELMSYWNVQPGIIHITDT